MGRAQAESDLPSFLCVILYATSCVLYCPWLTLSLSVALILSTYDVKAWDNIYSCVLIILFSGT